MEKGEQLIVCWVSGGQSASWEREEAELPGRAQPERVRNHVTFSPPSEVCSAA